MLAAAPVVSVANARPAWAGRGNPTREEVLSVRVPGSDAGARRAALALALVLTIALPGCTLFDDDTSDSVSVFELSLGDCVLAPAEPELELTEVATVPCDEPHEMEVYAAVEFPEPADGAATSAAGSTFPGDSALKDFADGTCAQEFAAYVGIDYRDSSLYFTYLVPSARGWEAETDRTVVCLITTTGDQLTQSVAGTGW